MKTDAKKIIVAGGTGLIGQELVKQLVQLGYQVVVLSRAPSKVNALFNSNKVLVKQWSGTYTSQLTQEIENSYAVINLAGENISAKRWTSKRRKELTQSRIRPTQALAKACAEALKKPEVFIQASAIGYYPFQASSTVFTEDSEPGTGFLSNLTAKWEAAAKEELPTSIRLVTIRTGVVLSEKGGMYPKLRLPIKLFVGGWFGNGNQSTPWIHITDHVNAIIHLLKNNATTGPYNLVSPKPVTQKVLVKLIAQKHKRVAFIPIPSFITKLIFGEMGTEILLNGAKVSAKKLINSGFSFSFPSIEASVNNLAQTPI